MLGRFKYSLGGRLISLAGLCLAGLLGLYAVLAPYNAQRTAATILSWVQFGDGGAVALALDGQQSLDHALADLLGRQLANAEKRSIKILNTSGSAESLRLLQRGAADAALVLESAVRDQWQDFAAIASVGMRYVHVIVPTDSTIHTFRDVAGKKLGVGPQEGDAAALAGELLDFFKFTESPELVYDQGPDLERAFLDGRINAALVIQGLNAPPIQELLAKGWYRLVSIAEAESIAAALPYVQASVFPNNSYGIDRALPSTGDLPFGTLAIRSILVAGENTADRLVYAVLTQLYSPGFLNQAPLPHFSEAEGTPSGAWPMHPAASAYYLRHAPVTWRQMATAIQIVLGLTLAAIAARGLWRRRERLLYQSRRRAAQRQLDALKTAGLSLIKADTAEEGITALRQMAGIHQWAEQSLRSMTMPPDLVAEINLALGDRLIDALAKWIERRPINIPPPNVPPVEKALQERAEHNTNAKMEKRSVAEHAEEGEPPLGVIPAPETSAVISPEQEAAETPNPPNTDSPNAPEDQSDQLFLF